MNFKYLRYFNAVAEDLHFRRAAERLNITQSPLSVAIQNLEAEFGAPLFKRNQRRVELTEIGTVLQLHASKILSVIEECETDIRALVEGTSGRLRIGFTSASSLLSPFPSLVNEYRRRYPQISVELLDRPSLQQLRELDLGALDAGVVRRPASKIPRGLGFRKLARDPLVVALPQDHPLACRDTLKIEDLRDEGFVFPSARSGAGLYDQLLELFELRGFVPRVVHEAHEAATIIGLVAANVGIAVVPHNLHYINVPNIAFVSLSDSDATTDLLLAFRAGEENPRVVHLIHLAQSLFREI